jgi:hypothetical protein
MSKFSAIGQTALVVVSVALIIVSAGAGYLASSSRTVISTLTTTETAPTVTTTFTLATTQSLTTTEIGPILTTTFTLTTTPSQVLQTTASCSISGQPGGLMLRILSNSTLQPVVGANVSATNTPASCDNTPATKQITMKFTTNGTVWYSLPTDNDASYSFVVSYSNQNYNFNATLAPVSLICATLYLPSGKTNITNNGFQSTCK